VSKRLSYVTETYVLFQILWLGSLVRQSPTYCPLWKTGWRVHHTIRPASSSSYDFHRLRLLLSDSKLDPQIWTDWRREKFCFFYVCTTRLPMLYHKEYKNFFMHYYASLEWSAYNECIMGGPMRLLEFWKTVWDAKNKRLCKVSL